MSELRRKLEDFKTRVSSNLTIYGAKNVFSQIDSTFKGLKILGQVNSPDYVGIYDIIETATFAEVFLKLDCKSSLLSLSEDVVVRYCSDCREDMIKENLITYFYLGDMVLARVTVVNEGLHINRCQFNTKMVLSSDNKNVIVIPFQEED